MTKLKNFSRSCNILDKILYFWSQNCIVMKKVYVVLAVLLGTVALLLGLLLIRESSYSRKCDGLDVSHYQDAKTVQGKIDSEDLQFIIAKATEGKSFRDKTFERHKRIAREHNLKFGAYHFLTMETPPKEQFEHFKNVVGRDIDIIPCLDVEAYYAEPGSKERQCWPRKQAREFVKEWSQLCKDYYGHYPIIYCTDWYRATRFYDMPNKFWIANKYIRPVFDCVIHQYSHNNDTIDFNHLPSGIDDILL